jgi:bifunctional DNA-binding transcriptional regulator/antitoxin component of YhaV-PrlF toxin-antitoxin module
MVVMKTRTLSQTSPISTIKVETGRQITIPKSAFDILNVAVGDYLDVRVIGGSITMVPRKLISNDQAWFYTKEWQTKEQAADEAIASGQASGPFDSASDLLNHLHRKAQRVA